MSQISEPVYSKSSYTKENCIWVHAYGHYVCISYKYYHLTGLIKFGASVTEGCEPDEYKTKFVDNLTEMRYDLYPIEKIISPNLTYEGIIEKIVDELAYGIGCYYILEEEKSNYDYENDPIMLNTFTNFNYDSDRKISRLKTVHNVFTYNAEKKPIGKCNYYEKDYYIAFRGTKTTGELEYGICVIDYHIENGETPEFVEKYTKQSLIDISNERLFYSPISMIVPYEFRDQLDRHSENHEDIMYCIIDHFNKGYSV